MIWSGMDSIELEKENVEGMLMYGIVIQYESRRPLFGTFLAGNLLGAVVSAVSFAYACERIEITPDHITTIVFLGLAGDEESTKQEIWWGSDLRRRGADALVPDDKSPLEY